MSVCHTGRYICFAVGGCRGCGGGGAVRLLVDLVPMLEPKKKKKNDEKGYFFFKLGSAQRCHRLESENGILVGKG